GWGGEEIDPPPWAWNCVEHGGWCQLWWDGESVAGIADAVAGDGGIHGKHQGVESCFGRAFDESVGDFAVTHDVKLEPVSAVGVGGLDVFNRGSAQGGQGERN